MNSNESRRPPQSVFTDGLDYPRIGNLSFRRGTLTESQQRNWEEYWPVWGKGLEDAPVDTAAWFNHPGEERRTILEIGSGTGTSTVAMAPLEADADVIAVELYKPGLAKLMGAMLRDEVHNIRMIRADGVEVLHRMIAPESLDGVRIFFPDPWPKARHHKRRIIQTGTLRLIASRLKPGGVLHVATDHPDYAEWIAERAEAEPQLAYRGWPWEAAPILTDRQVITKFEGRGLRQDYSIHEFLWEKR